MDKLSAEKFRLLPIECTNSPAPFYGLYPLHLPFSKMHSQPSYISLFDETHPVSEINKEGHLTVANTLFYDWVGGTSKELLNHPHPCFRDKDLLQHFESRQSWEGIITLSGYPPMKSTLLWINGEDGTPEKGLLIQKPIKERTKTPEEPEKDAKQLLGHLRLISDNAAVVTTLYTRKGKPEYISPVAQRVFGYTPEELMTLPSYHGIAEEHLENYLKYVSDVLKGKLWPEGFEFRYTKKDKEQVWLAIQINPVKDEKGNITHLQSCTRNIDKQKRYELRLKESEASASAILNSSDSLIILMDENQRIIKANDKVRVLAPQLFGKSIKDINQVQDLIPQDQRTIFKNNIQKALKGEPSSSYHELVTKSGKKIDLRYQYAPVWLHDGTVSAVSWMATDVSDMKKAQDYTVSLLKRLNLANHAAGIGIWEYNIETKKIKFDDQCLQLFQGAIGVETNIDVWAGYYEKKAERKLNQIFNVGISQGQKNIDEMLMLYPNIGNISFHHIRGQVEFERNQPKRAVGVMMDVSKTKKFEQNLESSKQKLNDAHKLARMAGFEYQLTGKTVSWTDNCFALHGLSIGQALSFQDYITRVHSADRPRFTRALRQVIRQNHSLEFSYRYVADGIERTFNLTLKANYFRNRPTKIVGTIQDITDNVSLQKALEQKKALLDASSKRLSDYSFVNSHKVRAPLSNILGLVQIIRMDNSDDLLDMLERSAEDLDQVIHELNSILGE